MIHPDIVGTLQALEPKLPLIYRKDIREATTEIVRLRAKLEAALAANRDPSYHNHMPDYPERQ
jgi:hypothetical protein